MANLKDLSNMRPIYKHNTDIFKLSVQKDSPYIAIVARNEDGIGPHHTKEDLYIINISLKHTVLIREKFDEIKDIDISHRGDIVLANYPIMRDDLKRGIYLIGRNEIGKQNPKLVWLKDIRGFSDLEWAPNGRQIAYGSTKGVYLYDVNTENETLISKKGRYLAFSPDGEKLAFSYFNNATGNIQIDIISLDTLQPVRTINDFIWHQYPSTKIIWSPDGEYLIYRATVRNLLEQNNKGGIFAVPVGGGSSERIGTGILDWINSAYPVEPTNRLTTLWSKIKR